MRNNKRWLREKDEVLVLSDTIPWLILISTSTSWLISKFIQYDNLQIGLCASKPTSKMTNLT